MGRITNAMPPILSRGFLQASDERLDSVFGCFVLSLSHATKCFQLPEDILIEK
jgi:hypothetical protein